MKAPKRPLAEPHVFHLNLVLRQRYNKVGGIAVKLRFEESLEREIHPSFLLFTPAWLDLFLTSLEGVQQLNIFSAISHLSQLVLRNYAKCTPSFISKPSF